MPLSVIPTIGSSGTFVLNSPLNNLISSSEKYTCQALRTIGEYIANNEDAEEMAYTRNGLSEANYNLDYKNDEIIASLEGDTGHWLFIPVKYIASYPLTNGIPYRAVMIGVSLPSIPVNKNLSNVETSIRNLIMDTIGVNPVIKTVETSRVVLVSKDIHDQTTLLRDINISSDSTDTAKYNSLLINYQRALDKITELELFIKNNFI